MYSIELCKSNPGGAVTPEVAAAVTDTMTRILHDVTSAAMSLSKPN
jgi:hypothetical protein